MFKILPDKTICITRGDIANLDVSAKLEDGVPYQFHASDVVRFHVYKKNDHADVVIKKDFGVEQDSESVNISLTTEDTRIGDVINKPVEYWYEVVVNPDTAPQTIIGYDDDGPKIYRVFPEGVSE